MSNVDAVCTNCGYHGVAVLDPKGSCLVELALWIFFIVPGLIYSLWSRSAVQPKCPRCGSFHVVPDDTEEGMRVLAKHSGTAAPAAGGVAAELERLASLRDRGFLTDEEFDRQKRRLLDGI